MSDRAYERPRCQAMLKYVWRWRCSRDAVTGDGLCAQHHYFGAKVPAVWRTQAEPEAPYRFIPGARSNANDPAEPTKGQT